MCWCHTFFLDVLHFGRPLSSYAVKTYGHPGSYSFSRTSLLWGAMSNCTTITAMSEMRCSFLQLSLETQVDLGMPLLDLAMVLPTLTQLTTYVMFYLLPSRTTPELDEISGGGFYHCVQYVRVQEGDSGSHTHDRPINEAGWSECLRGRLTRDTSSGLTKMNIWLTMMGFQSPKKVLLDILSWL